jgi:hypothetical protein
MDRTFDMKGRHSWMIAFENGEHRQYGTELALQQLQLVAQEPAFVLEKPVLLREFSLAIEHHVGEAAFSSCAVRALYFALKALNGDADFDLASDRGVPAILVTSPATPTSNLGLGARGHESSVQVRRFVECQPWVLPRAESSTLARSAAHLTELVQALQLHASKDSTILEVFNASMRQDSGVVFDWSPLQIESLAHQLCRDVGDPLSATALRHFVNANHSEGHVEFFCLAVCLRMNVLNTGVYAKTSKAKVYRTSCAACGLRAALHKARPTSPTV